MPICFITGVRKDDPLLEQEMLNENKKKKSLLDPEALASVSEDEHSAAANHHSGRRPSFEADLFGDAPSNAAQALLNDKELAGV
jgi:hypothetical protein